MVVRGEGRLAGCRVLAPPSRVAVRHPLAGLLARAGAEPVVFPRIAAAAPPDASRLSVAAASLAEFDWVVVAGRLAARNLLAERTLAGWPRGGPRVAAIGSGAAETLHDAGLEPLRPTRHTAAEVTTSLGRVAGLRVLLVRGADASDELPQRLRAEGAVVDDVAGFAVIVEASPEEAQKALVPPPDGVALANPTAVRLLARSARELELDLGRCVAGAVIAAAGPATARAAQAARLPATLVADGHLAALVCALEEHFRRGPEPAERPRA